MHNLLLAPPVAFMILLALTMGASALLSGLSFKAKEHEEGETKAYACGEDVQEQASQPDYGQFFPFAFFFTILHVTVLIIATIPVETRKTFIIAIIYIATAITGLSILFRRTD